MIATILAGVTKAHAPVPVPAMPLCSRCGVIAPAQSPVCLVCGEPSASSRTSVRPTAGHAWVAVRCSFQCRSCQFLSPLDELDIDGSVECAQCGQSQRFDVDAWHEALAFAHGIGDLGFPLPEGRLSHANIWIGDDNPYLAIGHTAAFAEHRQSSMQMVDGMTVHRSLFIEAGPGHPICEGCRTPLEIEIDRSAGTRSRCDGCGTTATYRLPNGATRYCAGLLGVVADAHCGGQRRARMQSTAAGPTALQCPECGGALPATRERVLRCEYCGTASLVPAQARTRDVGQVLTPDIWWLAFAGPSNLRRALEDPPAPAPIEAETNDALAKLKAKAPATSLELVAEKPGTYLPQLLLNLLLPGAALLVAIILYVLFGGLFTGLLI
jgi:hypothetical protein